MYLDGCRKNNESIEAFMGKCVHATLEWLYNKNNMRKPYITFDKICETYDKIWKNLWHKKIFIVASPNVQTNFRLQLFDENKLKQDNGMWVLKNSSSFLTMKSKDFEESVDSPFS